MPRSLKNIRNAYFCKAHTPRKASVRAGAHLLSALAAAALGLGLLPAASLAAGYSYQQHTLNAGILVNGTDPAPYLFYVLNNRPDVRPPDLTLINPLAPATVTPNTPAYWEVPLNTISDGQLAQYDVLYLPADGVTFGPIINEKLRRFVDNGGQLIVEYGTALSPAVAGLFTGTGPGQISSTSVSVPPSGTAFLRHPIIAQPYLLSAADMSSLASTTSPLGYDIGVNTLDPVHGATAGASSEYANVFSPVLLGMTGTAPSTSVTGTLLAAAQIGAGQVVVSALNLGPNISVHNAAAFAPTDLYTAPVTDLKLLTNILAWSEAHPNENKTSHGDAANNGLASFSPAWQYLPATAGAAAPSGAAVWGNFVFAVDAAGTLHAFDAYPSENLTGTASASGAEQVVTGLSQYPLTSYDEIWNASIGASASTPTVASFKGVNYVFVEKKDGSVAAFNAVTGAAPAAFTLSGSGGGNFGGNAPGPTYYDGRLYAGQADGTLHVYDLNEGGVAIPVTLEANQNVTGEVVTGAPVVGTLTNGNTNVLVAVVPTNANIYTVLLGARNEALKQFSTNGSITGYSINRLGNYDLNNIFADTASVAPPLLAYDYNGNVVTGVAANSTAPNPQDPLFAITNTLGYYTDWNMDFNAAAGNGPTGNPLNVNFISADSYGQLQDFTNAAAVSAPASDRRGNYYYTETMQANSATNSYLVGVTNAPLHSNVHVKFRFLMPTQTGLTDADNVNYSPLVGFHFVGAPVVDNQGNVYAAATNGTSSTPATQATVLCFRGDQAVSVTEQPGSTFDLSQATITQPDENSSETNTIQRGPDTGVGASATYGQYVAAAPTINASGTVVAPSSLTFYNFGKRGRSFAEIAGNLTEPQPITATLNDGTSTAATLPLQTNLAWYVQPFALTTPATGATAGSIQGLSLVGSSLFLCDGTSLYRLSTDPQVSTAQVPNGTQPAVTSSKVVTTPPSVTPIGAGLVGTPPSVGGSVMAINGTNGIAARTRQVTVIADSNRVLGVDGDGSAVWSVDATTRTDLTQTPAVSTRVPFSRPTSLSAFAVNDYLAADTGTNRCVRFDAGGDVKWELTRFQDPYGLMAAGQPLTLNQPTSVVTRPSGFPVAAPSGDYGISYLVADSGNDRIVEVTDFYNSTTGALDPNGNHVLTWVSHTGDQGGRSYRYGSATYYPNTTAPSGLSIAAIVTNTRLAPLVANPNTTVGGFLLGPASSDAPGGSIAVFNYPAAPVAYSNLASSINDLAYTVAGFYTASVGANGTAYTPVTIRSPRFLEFYTPAIATAAPSNAPPFNFLYADDNGVFDISYDLGKGAFVAGADRLQFRPASYQAMTAPTDAPTNGTANTGFSRGNIPFIPTCVQALSTDSQPTGGTPGTAAGGTANVTRRYLITQSYSQGELGTPSAGGRIGGEIFEIDVAASLNYPASSVSGTIPPPTVTSVQPLGQPGGFGSVLIPGNPSAVPPIPAVNQGSTLSHPALTGPLTQPTFAVRLP